MMWLPEAPIDAVLSKKTRKEELDITRVEVCLEAKAGV
jgi:hypothetical protein